MNEWRELFLYCRQVGYWCLHALLAGARRLLCIYTAIIDRIKCCAPSVCLSVPSSVFLELKSRRNFKFSRNIALDKKTNGANLISNDQSSRSPERKCKKSFFAHIFVQSRSVYIKSSQKLSPNTFHEQKCFVFVICVCLSVCLSVCRTLHVPFTIHLEYDFRNIGKKSRNVMSAGIHTKH